MICQKRSAFAKSVTLDVIMEHNTKKNMFTEYRKVDKMRELFINFKGNMKCFTRFEFLTTVELKFYDPVSTGGELPTATSVTVYTADQRTRPAHSKSCLYRAQIKTVWSKSKFFIAQFVCNKLL